jgi:hypothetical protein
MTTKDLIIQELDQLPESALPEILEIVRRWKHEQHQPLREKIWQAYLDSERERKEVYQRLANS